MRATLGIAIITLAACALVMTTSAYATPVIPKSVEFTNDEVEQDGKPQVCIVTVTIKNPPASEVVKIQFMIFINGRFAFMVTAAI